MNFFLNLGFLCQLLEILFVIIFTLIGVAYLTLAERKILGSMQRRKGPNVLGWFGVLQPLADGLKLFLKEGILPQLSIDNKFIYFLAPILSLSLSLLIWAVIPYKLGSFINDNDVAILFILAVSSLSVYGVLYSGWASNSKYAFIGSLRSTAQLISYEVSIGLILMSVISLSNSFNLTQIYLSQIFIENFIPLLPIAVLFFISALAETNRSPFDLVEGESELVAGFLVEYGSMTFAALYLSEYSFILFMSAFTSLLFFGSFPGSLGTIFIAFGFILIRATSPRVRFDQLITLGWKYILPFSISYFILVISIILSFEIA